MDMETYRKWLDGEPIGNIPPGAEVGAVFHDEDRDVHGLSFEFEGVLVLLFRVHAPWAKRARIRIARKVRPYWNRGTKARVNRSLYLDYLGLVRGVVRERVRCTSKMEVIAIGEGPGAAVARLAALDIAVNFPERRVSCAVFFSPDLGNKAFEASFARRVPAFKEAVDAAE